MMNDGNHHDITLKLNNSNRSYTFITHVTDVCMVKKTRKIMKVMKKEEEERIKKRKVGVKREWISSIAVSKRFPLSW